MAPLSNRATSISRRLTWMNMLVSGAALLLATISFIAYDLATVRTAIARNLTIQAQIAGSNSVAAVLFEDPDTAKATLSSLDASPGIVSAGIYSAEGHLFASYRRAQNGNEPPDMIKPDDRADVRWLDDRVLIVKRIVFEGAWVSIVYIESDLEEINERLRWYATSIAVVILSAMLGALIMSFLSQRSISKPIVDLAGLANRVTHERDYSLRASVETGLGEVSVLVDAFNEMLSQIQARDRSLQEARSELETRVLQRTAELKASNEELEAFSYSVSHDLRTPLRGIDGFSLALIEDCGEMLDDGGKDHLRRIRAATQRMGVLIDDLLNLSRVTRVELKSESFDISALAQTIATDLKRTQKDRQVEFTIEEHLVAEGDPHLLRQVLENLLNNAWKFTSKQPTAHIEFGQHQVDGTTAFYVKDDGAGFDPAFANRLFGAFQRLHAVTDFPGTGVGLAVVARIIRRHGGRVWADAAVGRGATFFFTLGDRRPPNAPTDPGLATSASGTTAGS